MNRSKKKKKRREQQELAQLEGIKNAFSGFSETLTPEESLNLKVNLLERIKRKNKEFEEMQRNDTTEEC